MAILERYVQKVRPGKWEELEELDKQNTVLEERHGFPPKTRYTYISGPYDSGTLVVERLWESFSAGEAAHEKLAADPEAEELSKKAGEILKSSRLEFLSKLE